jgi:hypothetical protein
MRRCLTLVVTIVLLSQGLTAAMAAPRYTATRFSARYSSCSCHFGYDRNSVGFCAPVVSCYSEGGRCSQSCGSLPDRAPAE